MAKGAVMCICILMSLTVILSKAHESSQENRKRTETDLVSNFFSELGNLFLDIDETLAIQTAPKTEFEGIVAQLLRPSNEHFSKVQGNYRTLQKRLGTFIRQPDPSKSIYTDLGLSTVEPQKHEGESKDFSARLPVAKVDPLKLIQVETEGNSQSTVLLNAISDTECSMDIISSTPLESEKRKACLQRFKRHVHDDDRLKRPIGRKGIESRRKNQLHVAFDADELYTYPYGFFRRGGDLAESTPKPQGRILGDILYSESSFDRNLRQLLKDHGRWLLDNPFLARWRKSLSKDNTDMTTEASTVAGVSAESSSDTTSEMESTQAYIPITTEYNTEIPVSRETYSEDRLPLNSASYYRLMDTDGIVGDEVEVVLNPNFNRETVHIVETNGKIKRPSSEESVILAFTQDGIPLKLRMGPEIENPSRFLHKVLKSAGVSLNVPVESLDDVKPVGKEILKFGAGVLTRPTYYDLSNRDDLKTLLITLKLKHRETLNSSS